MRIETLKAKRRARGGRFKLGLALRASPFSRAGVSREIKAAYCMGGRRFDSKARPRENGLARRASPTLITTGGLVVLLCALFLASVAAEPPKPSPPTAHASDGGRQTYDSFRLVHTRNVFDPDRRPARASGPAAPTAAAAADYLALTGIALDGEQTLAFFSGSRAEFNKVVPAGTGIGGATITKINPMNIEVERHGRHLVVAVGQTVPLDDKSNPAAAPVEQPAAAPASGGGGTSSSPAAGSNAAAPAPPGNLDEIRRRMMERHNQEQK